MHLRFDRTKIIHLKKGRPNKEKTDLYTCSETNSSFSSSLLHFQMLKMKPEQLTIEFLFKFLKHSNIDLKSTHGKLCFPIIVRLYRKMKLGIKFHGIKVDNGIIIDGHHRFLASILAGVSIEIYPSNRTSATNVIEWNLVELDKVDWDTEAKILVLNQIDAEFNNISMEKLSKLLG